MITTPARPTWLPETVWPYPLDTIEVGGRRVVYTDTGGPGPVLLLVHVGMWSLLWGGLIGELAERYRCVTLDPPSTGLSERVPREEQTLTAAAAAVGALIDELELREITLVLHDLGGLAALAAARTRLDRVTGVAAVNTFGWRPRGIMLPVALRVFGSAPAREIDAFTGLLARASSTRLGVGRRLPRPARRAWRAGLDDRRAAHRLFHDAARNRDVHEAADAALAALAGRPAITIFGAFSDCFRFQRQWHERLPGARRQVVPRGLHFPMCGDPALVARQLDDWHRMS